ncbi:MAG: DMT family transporter [Anaerolineae bacterium]|nr:DMT family transporter [Anaerolineae bacterium]
MDKTVNRPRRVGGIFAPLVNWVFKHRYDKQKRAWLAALLSPLFLGASPIFGKLATNSGADPLMVAAVRTLIAALILWITYLLFWRKYIYIFAAGLLGCVLVGLVNGIGSIFYYAGLARLDASVAQLLNGTYLVFVVVLARIGGTKMSRRTKLRVILACAAVALLTAPEAATIDWLGVGFMVGNAIMFAGHVVMGQRVLYEMPPQTFTLYVITTMATVVTVARLGVIVFGMPLVLPTTASMIPITGLAFTTAMSRLLMFTGVKNLGPLQTVLLGVAEIAVSLTAALVLLGERLEPAQWVGAVLMVGSMSLVRTRQDVPDGADVRAMRLPNLASLAGRGLFKGLSSQNASPVSGIPEAELEAIRKMMGPASAAFFENMTPEQLQAIAAQMTQASAEEPCPEDEKVHPGEYRLGPAVDGEVPRSMPEGSSEVR